MNVLVKIQINYVTFTHLYLDANKKHLIRYDPMEIWYLKMTFFIQTKETLGLRWKYSLLMVSFRLGSAHRINIRSARLLVIYGVQNM